MTPILQAILVVVGIVAACVGFGIAAFFFQVLLPEVPLD